MTGVQTCALPICKVVELLDSVGRGRTQGVGRARLARSLVSRELCGMRERRYSESRGGRSVSDPDLNVQTILRGPAGANGRSSEGGAEAVTRVEGGGMVTYFEDVFGGSNKVHGMFGCWKRMVGINRGDCASARARL